MGDSDSDSESDLDFATLDLTGVDFDGSGEKHDHKKDAFALNIEMRFLAGNLTDPRDSDDQENSESSRRLQEISTMVADGRYVDALKSDTAEWLLCNTPYIVAETSFWGRIRKQLSKIAAITECVEAEFIAIAAFNLFLQLNYTGPTVDDESTLRGVNPHSCFVEYLSASENDEKKDTITSKRDTQYHNTVLSELAVDGIWPCQVAEAPYLLLLARCILATLSDPNQDSWASKEMKAATMAPDFVIMASKLSAASLWSARATVAHERLLLSREPTVALWDEIESSFPRCVRLFQEQDHQLRATLLLEYGLACYHFNQSERGKELFMQAMSMSGLSVELTGVQGKRTKFQTKATAQMIVRATSASEKARADSQLSTKCNEQVKSQMVEHSDDTVLLDRVSFEDKEESKMGDLTILDQSILLALCLDVKSNNPLDGLTEEQSAYLARVLCHHDDWIVYSTALLERAWLEFEGNHTKERAILQMQALADQHTNRLTITQSTRQSVEDSSPVQDRVKNLHSIVYPPRWQMLRDVAERYAQLGIVTSAAEIFTEIECWDEVVDCYRRAGKEKRAEEIVRERLAVSETPRMWAALGDITDDPRHYEEAIKLSKGRFSQAYISLGKYYFDKGDLNKAADAYRRALKLRPLIPSVWFRVGTISMQLGDWEGALAAFSEVVQQQPDEAEGWANVAAVHMHNKHPAGAYPALVEVRKRSTQTQRPNQVPHSFLDPIVSVPETQSK
jgi:tetratricopeptide (TPR) repeat protein